VVSASFNALSTSGLLSVTVQMWSAVETLIVDVVGIGGAAVDMIEAPELR
jgi:hypothetical protein